MSEVLPVEEDPRFRLSTASDGQTDFTVPFPFQANADIVVVKIVAGLETVLAEAADYALTGAGETSGGTVTLVDPAEAGWQFLIYGRLVLDRLTSIVRGGKYNSRATDDDLDRAILALQEARRDLDRAVKVKMGATQFEIVAGADNTLLRWSGGRLVDGPVWGGDFGMPAPAVAGVATIDFGAAPGAGETSLVVTGISGIPAGALVEAWLTPIATNEHSADEHKVAAIRCVASDVVADVGFILFALAAEPEGRHGARHYGHWSVAWRYT